MGSVKTDTVGTFNIRFATLELVIQYTYRIIDEDEVYLDVAEIEAFSTRRNVMAPVSARLAREIDDTLRGYLEDEARKDAADRYAIVRGLRAMQRDEINLQVRHMKAGQY